MRASASARLAQRLHRAIRACAIAARQHSGATDPLSRRAALQLGATHAYRAFLQTRSNQIEEWTQSIFTRFTADDDSTVEGQYGDYTFHMRRKPGDNYHVVYRTRRTGAAIDDRPSREHEIVLDMNVVEAAYPGAILSVIKPSPDPDLVGFLLDTHGHDEKQLFLRHIPSGRMHFVQLPSWVRGGVVGFDWGVGRNGAHVLYLAVAEENIRSNVVLRAQFAVDATGNVSPVGRQQDIVSLVADVLKSGGRRRRRKSGGHPAIPAVDIGPFEEVYREDDAAFFLDVVATKDGRLVIVHSNSKDSGRQICFDATDPDAVGVPLLPYRPGTLYFLDSLTMPASGDDGIELIVASNCRTGRSGQLELFSLKLNLPLRTQDLSALVPISTGDGGGREPETILRDIDVFQAGVVCYGQTMDGRPRLQLLQRSESPTDPQHQRWSAKLIDLKLPGDVFAVEPHLNQNFRSESVQFHVSSPVIPDRLYEYNLRSGELRDLSPKSVPPIYTARRLYVKSHDGAEVPLTLVGKTAVLEAKRPRPCLMIGYGAYGVSEELGYRPHISAMVDAGWLVALAHVRGGSEKGTTWYHDGRQLKKWNTFKDFARCAEHLIDERFTEPKMLCAESSSAGALIMGVMANEHPDMFKALVFEYPFLDVLTAMQNPKDALTVHEYEEWGNVSDPAVLEYIRSYSPLQNIRPHNYPDMLITAAFGDTRVNMRDAMVWAEQIRKQATNRPTVLLQVTEGGHWGPRSLREKCHESAVKCVFLNQRIDR